MSRRERLLYLCGVVLICVFLRLFCHQQPCSEKQTVKQTNQAVAQIEQTVKSQDATVTKIVTDAHKEVESQNANVREDVKSLSPDAVATQLMALLTEYRGERGN